MDCRWSFVTARSDNAALSNVNCGAWPLKPSASLAGETSLCQPVLSISATRESSASLVVVASPSLAPSRWSSSSTRAPLASAYVSASCWLENGPMIRRPPSMMSPPTSTHRPSSNASSISLHTARADSVVTSPVSTSLHSASSLLATSAASVCNMLR